MFSIAREIPNANLSTHEGKWEKSKYMGVELYAKTLGIIGCGNIGAIVASRALGLQMDVISYDPFLSEERANELGVEKVEFDDLLKRSDFITIHVPKNAKTTGLINAEAFSRMKDGVRVINCARGGIVVEADLLEAIESGKVAGAALDVFEVEPAKENPLFGNPKVICTPHLGASTSEAQVNVAIQVAEQMSEFLINGAVTNALNMPSISAEDAPKLKPYMKLAEQLGSLSGQINEQAVLKVQIKYDGSVSELNTKPLTAIVIANILRAQLDSVNMVNALKIAESRDIDVIESKSGSSKDFRSLITVTVTTDKNQRIVAGTLFTGKEPRIVNIEGVPVEAALSDFMLYITNDDKPGFIGGLGGILSEYSQNIADFRLGRIEKGKSAVALISLDQPLDDEIYNKIKELPQIRRIKRLYF
jgi:D-3-phosphoglycerate dehydrogenase